jgi:hypothetical protein
LSTKNEIKTKKRKKKPPNFVETTISEEEQSLDEDNRQNWETTHISIGSPSRR